MQVQENKKYAARFCHWFYHNINIFNESKIKESTFAYRPALILKTVVWKNFIIRKRHWILTLFEAVLPILLFLLIAYGRGQITGLNKRVIEEPTYSIVTPLNYQLNQLQELRLLYVPNNEFYTDIISGVQSHCGIENSKVRGFSTVKEMMEYYSQNQSGTILSIVFKGNDKNNLNYAVRYASPGYRWDTGTLYASELDYDPTQTDTGNYIWTSYINFQRAVDLSYIEVMLGRRQGLSPENYPNLEENFTVAYEMFPYPPHVEDDGLKSMFMLFLPLITLFSFIFICPAVIKRVVEEKHSGIKELMKMVGMKTWMLWLGWYIYSILPMLLSIPLIVIFLTVPLFGTPYAPIEHADGCVFFVFLLLYCLASITFCFFVSSLFSKPSLAMIAGLVVWVLSYGIPKYYLETHKNNPLPFGILLLLNVFPNMALQFGYEAISPYEETGQKIHWSNLHKSGTGGTHEVTLAHVFGMLAFDIVFYLLLTIYVDNIKPGKYGTKKSIFYPLVNLIRPFRKNENCKVDAEILLDNVEKGNGTNKAIEIRRLYKKYGVKLAVDNLSLDIYEKQITVLLGHNGAGKSTTMAMITGMLSPTSGKIYINGKDSSGSIDELRRGFGLCTQHNLFFPDLTVAEHLEFFAMLKGNDSKETRKEIDQLLKVFNMEEKRNSMAHTLSGGMQRKLCLGMAVIGDSKVLILDEPTSGMDPESRRELWDLLLKWRGEKTILLTTHFMEEADALGDWISIMAEGRLQCYGTPMYLKKQYNTGYHLSLVVQPNAKQSCITDIVEQHIGNLNKHPNRDGNTLTYVLPFKSDNFGGMLKDLEVNKEELGIESMHITLTTLEDVFLKVQGEVESKSPTEVERTKEIRSKFANVQQKLLALLFKRFYYLKSRFSTYVIPLVVCLGISLAAIYLSSGSSNLYASNGSEIQLSLKTYGETKVYYNFTPGNDFVSSLASKYADAVRSQKGIPTLANDVESAIIQEGVSNIAFYKRHMLAAAQFLQDEYSRTELRFLYNSFSLHSVPISLNLIDNALVKAVLGDAHSISLSNWPLDIVLEEATATEISEQKVMLLWLLILPIGALFVLSSFIFFPYSELSTNFTQLQIMAGVSPLFYWLFTFVSDYVLYVIMMVPLIVITNIWLPLEGSGQIFGLLIIVLFYGLIGLPFAYLFSRMKSSSAAFSLFIIVGMFSGVLPTLIFGIMIESGDEHFVKMGSAFRNIFLMVFPQFGFTFGSVLWVQKVTQIHNFLALPDLYHRRAICKRDNNPCCEKPNSAECHLFNSTENLLINENNIWLMLVGAAIYFAVNVFLNSYLCKKLKRYINIGELKRMYAKHDEKLESLSSTDSCSDNSIDSRLGVDNLIKSYSGMPVVRNISFKVGKGQCVGILGVNGAGKSTTFKMLAREECINKGQVDADGNKIGTDKYFEKLGYCPQNDALNYVLTGRQILTLMARLRGNLSDVDTLVNDFLEGFELTKYADIPCGQYSGGNKRKLSLAVAIMGYPDYVLLDEPTNGVDPSTRRKFWTLIKKAQEKQNMAFILTSHSMVECEALCNDLKIMKKGRISKEGTISKLKQEVKGYSLKLKVKNKKQLTEALKSNQDSPNLIYDEFDAPPSFNRSNSLRDIEALKNYLLKDKFDGELKDEHEGYLHIYLKGDRKWSELFAELDELKKSNPHLIEDYSISEASLEDVFLNVAREEDVEKNEKKNKKNNKNKDTTVAIEEDF